MGTYLSLYWAKVEPLLRKSCDSMGQFHGSVVRDILIDHVAKGRWAVDNQAEQLLQELVREGIVECLERRPTVSQAAFIGLHYDQRDYDRLPSMAPGTVEHHWFRLSADESAGDWVPGGHWKRLRVHTRAAPVVSELDDDLDIDPLV